MPTCRSTPASLRHASDPNQEDVPGPVGRQQFLARHLQPEDQAHLHSDLRPLRSTSRTAGPEQQGHAGDLKVAAPYKQTERFESI